jgi:hypothetical protein
MVNYVYICSAGHSGSTLLDLILGSHSKASTLGEISHLSKNIALNTKCTCGRPVRECESWMQVFDSVGDQIGADVVRDPYALNMGFPRASVVIDEAHQTRFYLIKRKLILGLYYLKVRFSTKLFDWLLWPFDESIRHSFLVYDTVRRTLNADMVVDSSKEYLRAIGIYKHRPEKVRIILLTRDGRGVFYSNLKRGFSRRSSLNAWKLHYSRSLPLLKKQVDERDILRVRYEDLAMNTAEEVARLCEFLGLTYEYQMLDFSSKVHHSTNGNNMRFSTSSEIKLDSSWRDKISKKDLEYFDKRAKSLNRDLGYQ